MSYDIMLDLETLSTRPEAVILVIGAVKFNPFKRDDFGSTLYIKPDVDEQVEMGRHIDDNTVAWWGKQPDEVREDAMGEEGRISIQETMKQLNRFLVGADNIWAQGPIFDIGILENLYREAGCPPPWQHWRISDSRTVFKMHGDPREVGRENFHNALADCVYQAQGIQQVYESLGLQAYTWKNGPTAIKGT